MKSSLLYAISVATVLPIFAIAETPKASHPDLSGVWSYAIDLPPAAIKKEVNGSAVIQKVNHGVTVASAPIKGALPSTPAPSYKPELQAKVKDLFDHESKTDPVFYCAQPGVPRIGMPRKIIQSPREVVFLYEDVAGDPYRIIPVVGKGDVAG